MKMRHLLGLALILGATTAEGSARGADETNPELLAKQVRVELLREGISLDRLGLRLKLEPLPRGGYLVELEDRLKGRSVGLRKLEDLPLESEAAVAKLTIAVSRMVQEVEHSEPPRAEDEGTSGPRVHIESDDPATELFVHSGTAVASTGHTAAFVSRVCGTPCDKTIDNSEGHRYFLAGNGVTPSSPFLLPEDGSNVRIKVNTGNAWVRNIGYWVGSIGLGTAVVVASTLAIQREGEFGDVLGGKAVTWSLIGGGAALAVGGLVMILTNGTDYELAVN